ncbi:MAG: DNA methylase [Elusimicrobia bacterium HGW-Elusimicrobia-1]|jgi:very-short-patch-repair endonuclease|nr:MAG: DNA methylase [Elusimicrobia bacterium HGW-Elusimicrobia-1]
MTKIYYKPELKELARQLRNRATQSEIKLWKYLKGKQLDGYDFHRQKPIGDYIADFFCPKLKLALELDGYTHGFENVFDKDAVKTRRLNEMGITVLRFNDEDVVKNIDGVLGCIREYIEKHTPGPSL